MGRRWGGRNIREHVAVRSRIHCYVLLLLLFSLCCVMRRNGRIHTYLWLRFEPHFVYNNAFKFPRLDSHFKLSSSLENLVCALLPVTQIYLILYIHRTPYLLIQIQYIYVRREKLLTMDEDLFGLLIHQTLSNLITRKHEKKLTVYLLSRNEKSSSFHVSGTPGKHQ